MMEPHYDAVCILLGTPFCEWKEEDKQWILKNGRPTPSLGRKVVIKDSTGSVSNSQSSWYDFFPWLCGSCYLKKLFCWPCLIDGIEGYEMVSIDVNNVTKQLLTMHEASFTHLKSALRLKELSERFQVSTLHKKCSSLNIVEHNKNALLNRRLMQLLIKAILYFTKRQLPFNRHCQNKTVSSNGNIKELLNLCLCESPLELQQQFSNVKTYFESESVQNDLIHCLCTHINNFVKKDASESPFYSIELDRINEAHCVVTVRYVTSNGLVVERPLSFLQVSKSCSTENFFERLKSILSTLSYQSKLVAQCYDGASLRKKNLNELQSKVKLQAPQALFIHCCNHKFDELIVQIVNDIPECQAFFTKLYSMHRFFISSTRRLEILNSAIAERGIKVVIEKDHLSTVYEIVSAVYKLFSPLKDTFKNMLSDSSFDAASVRQSNTYLKYFKDVEFIFLSLVFNFILEIMKDLFDVLQIQLVDMSFTLNEVHKLQVTLAEHRTSSQFDSFYQYGNDRAEKILIGQEEYYNRKDVRRKFKLLYFKILDSINHELGVRFKDSEKLQFMCLAEWSNFKSFSKILPDSYIQPLIDFFPNVITDIDRLKNEFKLFYSIIPHKLCGIQEIITKMKEDGSCEIFKEVYKLFSLIITLPCIDVSRDSHIFSPRRIQSYLKNVNHVGKFQAFNTMLSIGQEVIDHLIKTSMFYDDVIDQFVSLKGQKIPLTLQR